MTRRRLFGFVAALLFAPKLVSQELEEQRYDAQFLERLKHYDWKHIPEPERSSMLAEMNRWIGVKRQQWKREGKHFPITPGQWPQNVDGSGPHWNGAL